MAEHATTGDAINHAIDKASDGLSQIAHALSGAAPQAWAVAVHGVYARGAATIVIGVIGLIAALVFIGLMIFGIIKCVAAEKQESEAGIPWLFLIVPCGILALIFLFIAAVNGLDGDAWARIISPDGYLAQQVLSKAL